MVSASQKSGAVQRCHDKITNQLAAADNMSSDDSNLEALSPVVSKMPGRNDRTTVEQTIDVLF